jgi:hypothetical protein
MRVAAGVGRISVLRFASFLFVFAFPAQLFARCQRMGKSEGTGTKKEEVDERKLRARNALKRVDQEAGKRRGSPPTAAEVESLLAAIGDWPTQVNKLSATCLLIWANLRTF